MKYPGRESVVLEFKEKIPTKNQIIKTSIGFCNRFGGRLIVGVKDNGEIIGVDESQLNELIDSLHESIFKSCTPTILPSIYVQRLDEKALLVVEVSPGMNKPYFLSTDGLMEGTYIRLGSLVVKAPIQLIEELKWQSRGFSADEMPVYHATQDDINDQLFFDFLKKRRLSFSNVEQQQLLRHYKLIIKEHNRAYPTTAAILLFGKESQRYFTEAFIICTHFKGTAGREVIATKDCMGNLFQQLEQGIDFVLSRLNKSFLIKQKRREERYEIPEVAIREMVINAVVHRDYHMPGPIKIAIYDNRIEIFSPGNFPGPLQVEHLEMGITYIRNTIICKILREAGYIEKLGSGFLTLFESYRQYDLPKPVVLENTGFIKCILPRPTQTMVTAKEDTKEQILRLFYLSDAITVRDIMKQFSVSRQTAARLLKPLIQEGFIVRRGKGPASHYILGTLGVS